MSHRKMPHLRCHVYLFALDVPGEPGEVPWRRFFLLASNHSEALPAPLGALTWYIPMG